MVDIGVGKSGVGCCLHAFGYRRGWIPCTCQGRFECVARGTCFEDGRFGERGEVFAGGSDLQARGTATNCSVWGGRKYVVHEASHREVWDAWDLDCTLSPPIKWLG